MVFGGYNHKSQVSSIFSKNYLRVMGRIGILVRWKLSCCMQRNNHKMKASTVTPNLDSLEFFNSVNGKLIWGVNYKPVGVSCTCTKKS